MKYTEQDLKDEHEQAVKRKGKQYADGYVEGLTDGSSGKSHRELLIAYAKLENGGGKLYDSDIEKIDKLLEV